MLLNNKLSHSIKAGRGTKLASPLQPFHSSGLLVPNFRIEIRRRLGEEHLGELGQLGCVR